MRLLLVEDDRGLRDALADRLRAAGYQTDAVGCGEDGLSYARRSAYDAVVLDLGLPDRDGLDVLTDLRRGAVTTPVLLLTARDGVDDRR